MSKKIILIVLALIILGLGVVYIIQNKETNNTNNKEETTENNQKSAVVYFSATGNTKEVSGYIAEEVDADLIEIIPAEEYTAEDLDYNNDNCRANTEQNNENARPEIANDIDVTIYDVIYLGYPIWWGDVPKIILTFLDNTDLNGKTVIPFCTSGGSSISTSLNTLKEYKSDINWIDGERLDVSKEAVIDFLNNLNY